MKQIYKYMIAFSIVYWLLVAGGLILTAFAIQKVPIGYYGLRVHYFSSGVDSQYYTNGLYHKGVGYSFVTYPQPRQYVMDKQITVINKDLQKITVTYTLCYRINPTGIYNIYNSVGDQYENHLVAIINNIISSVFSTLTQSQSRVSAQQTIVSEFNNNAGGKARVSSIFGGGIIVEAIWVNKLDFATTQSYYDSAYIYSSSSSPTYEAAAYNLTIAKLELNAINSSIITARQGFAKTMQVQQQKIYDSLTSASLSLYQQRILNISQQFNSSRVLNYYQPSSFIFY